MNTNTATLAQVIDTFEVDGYASQYADAIAKSRAYATGDYADHFLTAMTNAGRELEAVVRMAAADMDFPATEIRAAVDAMLPGMVADATAAVEAA